MELEEVICCIDVVAPSAASLAPSRRNLAPSYAVACLDGAWPLQVEQTWRRMRCVRGREQKKKVEVEGDVGVKMIREKERMKRKRNLGVKGGESEMRKKASWQ